MDLQLDQDRPTRSRQRALVLALAASAGAHAGLVPAHAAEKPLVGVLFACSALALAGCSVLVDRSERRGVLVTAGLLLGALLALYAASRMVVVWPLAQVEPIDVLGVITKLCEAAGLLLALSLLQAPSGSDETLPALREGAGR